MEFYRLLIGVLVVWRLTHLFAYEEGPFDAFSSLRRFAEGSFASNALGCFYCLSLWVSIPLAFLIGENLTARLLLWLALSAGAILLERGIHGRTTTEAIYTEDAETK